MTNSAFAAAALESGPTMPGSISEPRLRELIEDPIMRHLMDSDRIERDQLISLLREARARLSRR